MELLRFFVCSSMGYALDSIAVVTAIVKTVNTLYRDSDNLSAAGFEIILSGWRLFQSPGRSTNLRLLCNFFYDACWGVPLM